MATPALINIENVVSNFLLKYKKPTEDYILYLEHTCNCVRDFGLYDSDQFVTEKVAISALGIIEMPTTMMGFIGLYTFTDGMMWSFTMRDDIATTTTFTGMVEGQDATYGEGVALLDPVSDTYGAVGGVNDYYYKIDWKARRIFCEGIISTTVILRYVSSGVEITGVTSVPDYIVPMLDNYMLWKESYWIPALVRERVGREQDYIKSELKIRNLINSMTYEQWKDTLLGLTTMAPLR
jgi:hypothetical protein